MKATEQQHTAGQVERAARALRAVQLGGRWLVPEPLRSTGSPDAIIGDALDRLRALRAQRTRELSNAPGRPTVVVTRG